MSEPDPAADPERRLKHDADELEDRLHRLDEHLDAAEHKAAERRKDADEAGGNLVGDLEGLGPGAGYGQDPTGAAEDPDRD